MYIGPDAMMPVASGVAAGVGIVLMFWRRIIGAMRLVMRKVSRR